ncbi:hypothetical protein [Bosea lathyri]|uniref:Uncharacterized protein n=1 Tax=Bosea lathyri TaxID=1036778 RepID=A0A1H6BUY8_9HYPH|nr:hypothetical protein [Bosea lathyri]SEG64479.1 hypothetical protein SAMN04488115_10899 [Bosea lathyri]
MTVNGPHPEYPFLTWVETDEKTLDLFAGVWAFPIATLSRAKKHWHARIELPGLGPRKAHAPLAAQFEDTTYAVAEFFKRCGAKS